MGLPGDYLRAARKRKLEDASIYDAESADLVARAERARARAETFREEACQFGAGIQVLEGDDAVLDFPEPSNPEES